MEDQQCYIEALKSASGTAQAEGNVRSGDGREAESGGHRVAELERVITAMRKVHLFVCFCQICVFFQLVEYM